MTELAETRFKRLRLQSMRRGIKEMDLILSAFADQALLGLTQDDVALYDDLLSENDHDILAWVIGQVPTPARYAGLIGKVRQVAGRLPGGD